MSVRTSAAAAAHWGARTVDRLLERPRAVLGTLVGVQIAATVVLALSVDHNGWVWFQGGDQIWMTTTGWLLGDGPASADRDRIPLAAVQAPVTWATGPTYVQALPPLVLAQVLVLGPGGAALSVRARSQDRRASPRLLGLAPLGDRSICRHPALRRSLPGERWTEHFLPQALGLTALADFPSMVLVLAAALFVVRSLSPGRMTRRRPRGAPAGRRSGTQAAEPPRSRRCRARVRRRTQVARGARLSARRSSRALLVLFLWKVKGLGEVPAFALDQAQLAAGSVPLAADFRFDRYFELDFEHWREQMDQLREFFWSARLAQWAPVAGLVAVTPHAALARSPRCWPAGSPRSSS